MMAINEVNEAYKTGKEHERKRILDLIKAWELTDFGSLNARFEGMQELKNDIKLGQGDGGQK